MVIRPLLVFAAISLTTVACSHIGGLPNSNAQDANQASEQGAQRRPRHRIDFAAAAQKLGVTEAKLKEALGVPANPGDASNQPRREHRRPDLKAAATKLGVSEEKLRDALGIPERSPDNAPTPASTPSSSPST